MFFEGPREFWAAIKWKTQEIDGKTCQLTVWSPDMLDFDQIDSNTWRSIKTGGSCNLTLVRTLWRTKGDVSWATNRYEPFRRQMTSSARTCARRARRRRSSAGGTNIRGAGPLSVLEELMQTVSACGQAIQSLLVASLTLFVGVAVGADRNPDVIMLDSACSTMSSALGRNDKPILNAAAAKSLFLCSKRKSGFGCQMGSQGGDRYIAAGKAKTMVFNSISDNGDRFDMMADGALVYVIVDRNSQSYILTQTYVENASGLVMQKQCVGIYAAGVAAEKLLEKLGE